MHVYIYDSFVNQKKYDSVLARIETRLTDLGLNGKICRLGAMKNIRDMVESEIKRGAKTIVAVGNDQTVSQVIGALFLMEQKGFGVVAPLGIIPISEKENKIASALGIGPAEEACEVLSARRVEKLDLGIANNSPFLSAASIATKGTVLEISKDCSVEIMEEGNINIINLATEEFPPTAAFNPQDGMLELFIQTKGKKKFLFKNSGETNQSVFPLKKLSVFNAKNAPLILDGTISIPTPAEISVIKQKLNVIVGKGRGF